MLVAICFEGWGRKYVPLVPSSWFYFLKDGVVLLGLALGLARASTREAFALFGGFRVLVGIGVLWTVLMSLKPGHPSLPLAMIGVKSYWLWWLAPLLVAGAIRSRKQLEQCLAIVGVIGVVVGLVAVYEFTIASASEVTYAKFDGMERAAVVGVASTGKTRVSSTFSYMSGLADFVTLMPLLMLAAGLTARKRSTKYACLAGAAMSAVAMPMTGSRAPVVLGGLGVAVVAWQAGFLVTRTGRRVLLAGALSIGVGLVVFPDASEGVRSRFMSTDTSRRVMEVARILPPVLLAITEFPFVGTGTGTLHNARDVFRVWVDWDTESEWDRVLIEQGPIGYLVIWLARFGLVVALLRLGRRLKRQRLGAAAGAAYAYAGYTMIGPLYGDHVYAALYFTSIGFLLAVSSVTMAESEAGTQRPGQVPGPTTGAFSPGTATRMPSFVPQGRVGGL